MNVIIPAKDLQTPDCVYDKFEEITNEYRDCMRKYINNVLRFLPPVSIINQCITIEIEKLIECATTNHPISEDDYNYTEMVMVFTHFKTTKQIPQHNLIDYVLEDITAEMIKLGYNVTVAYSSSSINNKGEPPVSITLKWNHLQ